ncbi:MAG TPA: DUF177 domain-containing protein [Bacteroidetes bacterium]|nr:DUF177 domain-containing protein [Bacteroidota bacterium]
MKINIAQLAEGHHHLDLRGQPASVGLDDGERFRDEISVALELEKMRTRLYIRLEAHTQAHYVCDRCLEPFVAAIAEKFSFLYTEDSDLISPDDFIYAYDASRPEIDIAPAVKETILLGVPIKFLCSEECKGLCPQCGTNLNQSRCACKTSSTDPRWDALKKLIK